MGNGQSELIEGITGLRHIESGNVILDGKDITNKTPFEIINSGLSNIQKTGKKRGLVLDFTIAENMILENYHKEPFSKKGRLNHKSIEDFFKEINRKI